MSPFIPTYTYEELPNTSSFRILELLPGIKEEIEFILSIADWNNPPSYEALSYAWGDVNTTEPIFSRGSKLDVTTNLKAGLLQLRKPDKSRYIWADAACINQKDRVEKGHQVDNMRQIYRKAEKVLVWLGKDDHNGEVAGNSKMAMEKLVAECCRHSGKSITELKKGEDLRNALPANLSTPISLDDQFNEELWRSISWFFNQTWFSRLWVFQEVTAGPDVEMWCGKICISWDVVALTAAYINHSSHTRTNWNFLNSYYENAYLMRDSSLHATFTIPHILGFSRLFRTKDPLDRIYALLATPPFQDSEHSWKSNYKKSSLELYREVAERCILQSKRRRLQILSYVQHLKEENTQFPSWVPQWCEKAHIAPVVDLGMDFKWGSGGGDTSVSAEIDMQGSVLKIRGVEFDTIELSDTSKRLDWFQSEINTEDLEIHPVISFCYSQNGMMNYPNGTSRLEAYAMTLTAGVELRGKHRSRITEDRRTTFYANFMAFLNHLLKTYRQDPLQRSERPHGKRQDFEIAARDGCELRTFFTTKKGYMGLAPSDAVQTGDIVCVLFGGEVPHILKLLDNGYYSLIGDAYVCGLMDGEAILKCDAGELQSREFKIK